eukprot:9829188-Ditylum_brightwellii.AAC.1
METEMDFSLTVMSQLVLMRKTEIVMIQLESTNGQEKETWMAFWLAVMIQLETSNFQRKETNMGGQGSRKSVAIRAFFLL